MPSKIGSIERAELKLQSISLITAQHFDLFSAILESPVKNPRIDLDEADAEGRYIRFFEQVYRVGEYDLCLLSLFLGTD